MGENGLCGDAVGGRHRLRFRAKQGKGGYRQAWPEAGGLRLGSQRDKRASPLFQGLI